MTKREFPKVDLRDMAWDDHSDEYEKISCSLSHVSRWSYHYVMIFKYDGKYYKTHYSVGATEMQDESPYEYASDMIECVEVCPVEKVVIVYEEC